MEAPPPIRPLLLLVCAIVLVETMFFAAVTPLLPEYVELLGLSKASAGLLSAAYPLGVIVGAIPSGVLVARIGARATVLVGLLTLAITSVVFGFAGSIAVLDGARFAQGVAGAAAWTGGLAWLVGAAPPSRRGQLIGTAVGAAIGGALLGPVLGGVATVIGPATAFSSVGVLSLLLAAWAAATPVAEPVGRQPLRVLVDATADPGIRRAVWFVTLPALMFGTLSVLAPLRLSDLGLTPFRVGAVFFTAAAIEAIINPLIGRLSDRIGRLPPLRVGLVAAIVATLLLPLPRTSTMMVAAVLVASVSFGSFWAPAFSYLADASEARGLGHGYGFALMNLAWGPGQALGSGGGGALAGATSDAVSFALCAFACAVTLLLVRRQREVALAIP